MKQGNNQRQTSVRLKPLTLFVKRALFPATSFLIITAAISPSALAGPEGGVVTGGAGSISQSGSLTTIQQSSQNMAIDWQSYNLAADERVHYVQPNSSSISLNHILSNSGSTIQGRIDANGQVILVNPNGIFFTPDSVINVGGMIASGLAISADAFLNGNYIFDAIEGSDGTVINQGIINAALGGNVSLLGKRVENGGLITANLGTVSLAAGKQAVLSFDGDGLLGVRISEEILQDELGVEPAVLNSGEISAQGGQVLLTGSVSQDVFSQAVNSGDVEQATSVVVHEDGSFTLGGGADVVNSGSVDVSDSEAGRIVLLGENVTSSGDLLADSSQGNGGEIELHAMDTTLLTDTSLTSAKSEMDGVGGLIKVLGNKVGLFDQSVVDVSGANGGGTALTGGDYQGLNQFIRNAQRSYVGSGTVLRGDAIEQGDGGKLITWGDEYTWFYGSASARGGVLSGNGGLIEISGKGLTYAGQVDVTADNGNSGTVLFDPVDIVIDDAADLSADNDSELDDNKILHGDTGTTFYISREKSRKGSFDITLVEI
jgi:filamentous hemagglutinin family protein